MDWSALIEGRRLGLTLLCGGTIALYIAARAMVDAVGRANVSPWRRAVCHWLPIAMVAIYAMYLQRPVIALGVIFATSVASLTLVSGLTTSLWPMSDPPPRVRRIWPFVLPTALIVLMAGFSAHLTLIHALILAAEGLIVLLVGAERSEISQSDPAIAAPATEVTSQGAAQLTLGVLLLVCGAYMLVHGTVRIELTTPHISVGVIAATLLAPILTLPMIGSGSQLGERGAAWAGVGTGVGVVLLNLCLLLPAVIVYWHFVPAPASIEESAVATTLPATTHALLPRPSLPFPMGLWRIDTVILIVIGLLMIPVSLGRWTLGRVDGAILILGYLMYLTMTGWMGMRQ